MKQCNECGSADIKHEEVIGRGLPKTPRKRGDIRKISWRGIWDKWICNKCGNVVTKLKD